MEQSAQWLREVRCRGSMRLTYVYTKTHTHTVRSKGNAATMIWVHKVLSRDDPEEIPYISVSRLFRQPLETTPLSSLPKERLIKHWFFTGALQCEPKAIFSMSMRQNYYSGITGKVAKVFHAQSCYARI